RPGPNRRTIVTTLSGKLGLATVARRRAEARAHITARRTLRRLAANRHRAVRLRGAAQLARRIATSRARVVPSPRTRVGGAGTSRRVEGESRAASIECDDDVVRDAAVREHVECPPGEWGSAGANGAASSLEPGLVILARAGRPLNGVIRRTRRNSGAEDAELR